MPNVKRDADGRGSPVVREMRVVPVAGHDDMLLNLSGAHGPFFTRNVVILEDDAGHRGVGEVPGGEKIRRTLEDARPLVVGKNVGEANGILAAMRQALASREAGGRGQQTFDLGTTIHAVTAVESALLDLLGQHFGLPVAALLGEGVPRERAAVVGSPLSLGARSKPRLPYRAEPDEGDDWLRLRHEPAMAPESI